MQADRGEELAHFLRRELRVVAARQARRQADGSEADSHQAAYGEAQRLEHATHDAVAAFAQDDAIPAIGALAALLCDRVEPSLTVFQSNAGSKIARSR